MYSLVHVHIPAQLHAAAFAAAATASELAALLAALSKTLAFDGYLGPFVSHGGQKLACKHRSSAARSRVRGGPGPAVNPLQS